MVNWSDQFSNNTGAEFQSLRALRAPVTQWVMNDRNTFRCSGWQRVGTHELHLAYVAESARGHYQFVEKLAFDVAIDQVPDCIIEHAHVALGMSYWKAFVPCSYEIPYALDASAAEFWQATFTDGMGEFLLHNRVPFDCMPVFQATATQNDSATSAGADAQPQGNRILLGMGGGKDSIVAAELARQADMDVVLFVMRTGDQTSNIQAVCDLTGMPLVECRRYLDAQLFELNKDPHYLNGHIPFSMMLAAVAGIAAHALGCTDFVVGNESSSDTSQGTWDGRCVTHQWSKTRDFERLYTRKLASMPGASGYFSMTRSLSSVGTCRIFARQPRYFEAFTSDSSQMRVGGASAPRWNPEAAKTLSTYALLAPWLEPADLTRIFGFELTDVADVAQRFERMLDGEVFDCVGTPSEIAYSIERAAGRHPGMVWDELLRKAQGVDTVAVRDSNDDVTNIPGRYRQRVHDALRASLNT